MQVSMAGEALESAGFGRAVAARARRTTWWCSFAILLLIAAMTSEAMAAVVWEDYRGRSSVPLAPIAPTVNNYENLGASATVRQNLRDIYASPVSTPTRTGTSTNID